MLIVLLDGNNGQWNGKILDTYSPLSRVVDIKYFVLLIVDVIFALRL